jgi:hypothetical protein
MFVMGLGLAVCPLTLAAQSVTLAWNPSTSANVAGYMIYYGTDGTNFDSQLDAGTNTTATVTGLEPGSTNYFEVVAYDANDDLSPPSNEIEYIVPVATQTVTVLSNPTNAGGVTGGGSFASGTSVTVTATANSGYTFANWTENGTVQSTSSNYNFTLTTNLNLVANFTANPVTYAIAESASPSIGGTVGGGGTFASGSSQTVTATANSGYTFTSWTINGSVVSSSSSYTFTLTGNQTLVANFTANPVTYTIAASASPAAGGTVGGGGTFASGSSQTVTATANSGYTFTNWTVNGSVVSSSPNYSFTLAANLTLVANFTANPVNYTIATQINPANAGNVKGGGTFATGSPVTVKATANSGYTFTNWTANGIVQSASPDYGFTLATNLTLVANFTAISVTTNSTTNSVPTNAVTNSITYTVTSSAGSNGSIAPNGAQTVATGSNITFTATPASSYQVNQWLVNGTMAQTGGSAYTLQNVTTNDSVAVTFSANPPVANTNFTLLVSGKGTLSPSRTVKTLQTGALQTGKKYTLTAHAAKGSVFAGWFSNGVVVATTPNYTFSVESNLLLQADFIINPYIPVAGTYHGLFYVTNAAAEESSGSIVTTVSGTGAFSAKLRLGAGSYSYSGALSVGGAATKSITRPGLNPLTVDLQLDMTNGPLTGTISDGTWTADLVADADTYSKTNPAPQAGKYTLLIPGSENASTQPGGNGFGALIVSESGAVTFSGILGDGTAVSSTSIVSSEGQWPFYVSLYGGKGSILGWLSFTNEGAISGQTGWFKLPQATAKLYPGGFTNSAGVMGSVYQYTNGLPLLGFTDGQLLLTNGDLLDAITDQIGLGPEMKATDQSATNQNTATLTFVASSGLFKGNVVNPATGRPIAVNGVVVQNQNFGAGCFLGATESGSVLLAPTQ